MCIALVVLVFRVRAGPNHARLQRAFWGVHWLYFRPSNQDMVRTKSPSLLTDKTHFMENERNENKKIFLEKFRS